MDAVDCLRDDLNNGVGCRPPELRTNLLKLHQMAMTVVNNGSRSQATEMFDLAMDLTEQVSNMMTQIEQVLATLEKLVALCPGTLSDANFEDADRPMFQMAAGDASVGSTPYSEVKLNRSKYVRVIKITLALTGVLFGLMTIFAGTRVLTGTDPGYIVFLPLLVYNTAMGVAYIGAGVLAWYSLDHGRNAAAVIFILNLLVLAAIYILYSSGGAVAVDSLRAMTLRTAVWLMLFIGLGWLSRKVRRDQ